MSEDLIRRSDAIDVLYQYQESVEMGIKSFPLAVKAMNDIPTIEPKRGEWIEINIKDYKAKCSHCGTWSPIMGNFCPNFGAEMRGKDNE